MTMGGSDNGNFTVRQLLNPRLSFTVPRFFRAKRLFKWFPTSPTYRATAQIFIQLVSQQHNGNSHDTQRGAMSNSWAKGHIVSHILFRYSSSTIFCRPRRAGQRRTRAHSPSVSAQKAKIEHVKTKPVRRTSKDRAGSLVFNKTNFPFSSAINWPLYSNPYWPSHDHLYQFEQLWNQPSNSSAICHCIKATALLRLARL